MRTWFEMLGMPGAVRRARMRIRHRDGTWLWFDATHYNRLDDPSAPGIYTELLDISDEMAAHEALRSAERLLRRLTEALPLGVAQIDVQGRLIHRNDRLIEILGGARARESGSVYYGGATRTSGRGLRGVVDRVRSGPSGGGFWRERDSTEARSGYRGSQYQNRGSYSGSRYQSRPGGGFRSYSRGTGGFRGGGRR